MRRRPFALARRPQRPMVNPNFGKEPTVSEKIIRTSSRLGIGGIQNQQGAAVNIFDTVSIATNTATQTLTFFKSAAAKNRTFTNWQAQEFKAGESLGVKYIYVSLVKVSSADFASATNTITDYFPVGRITASSLLAYSMSSFKIANKVVWKDFQMLELLPYFNTEVRGIAAYDEAAVTGPVVYGRSVITLDAVPVVPPNQGIEFSIDVPPITLPAGTWAVQVNLGRQGSIYNAQTSL